MKKMLVLALLALGFSQEIPKPVGHVNDYAGIIPKDMVTRLEARLLAYKTETTNEVAVVTVKSLEGMSVEDYTIRLAKAWGVGNKKKDNGVVFLIAPKERRCRIEVGYGLEPKLTDIQAKRIIEDAVIPRFKQGQMPEGIEAGTEAIFLTLTGQVAPAAAPMNKEPGPNAGLILLIMLGVVFFVVVIAVVLNAPFSSGRSEWSSSSSGLGPIATGAVIGSLVSSLPRSAPKSSPPDEEEDDDDDTSRRSSTSSSSYDHHDSGSSFDSFGGFGGGSFGGGGASGSW